MGTPRKITNMEEESLFSLELVVDKLSIPDVVCRFPAIAFRLLDFPTLIIYHVEPDLAETIKRKISLDPFYKMPAQLHELTNTDGDFIVKKGKSCLFKVAPRILHNHLCTTPLYVMLIDTYPKVPKLIGSCNVALDATMDSVYSDLDKLGIATPSVHGEKGEYEMFNLMGTTIGKLTLGFRLLSLGMGLIPHIPDHAISRLGQNKQVKVPSQDVELKKARETADIVLQDLEAADKDVQVVISAPVTATEHQQSQTNTHHFIAGSTQTDYKSKPSKYKKVNPSPVMPDGYDDFFIINTVCPPPLFYNSEAESEMIEGLQIHDGDTDSISAMRYVCGAEQIDFKDDESVLEESTIRDEDKVFEFDFEERVNLKSKKVNKDAKMVNTNLKSSIKSDKVRSLVKDSLSIFGNGMEYPLLNALLSEILTLQGAVPSINSKQTDADGTLKSVDTPNEQPAVHPPTKQDKFGKENKDDFLSRLATPRNMKNIPNANSVTSKKGRKFNICETDGVPKNKSWIRQVPEFGVKKTKLSYGMTNTQRLRLAKGNPQLLKTIEKTEEGRPGSKQQLKGTSKTHPPKFSSIKRVDISTEIRRHPSMDTATDIQLNTMDRTGESSVRDSSEFRVHKKPVPTPRLSLKGDKDVRAGVLGQVKSRNHQTTSQRNILAKYASKLQEHVESDEDCESKAGHDSLSSRSQKSIEVHIPSATFHSDHEDNLSNLTEADNSELDDDVPFGKTKIIRTPGFPDRSSIRQSMDSRASDNVQYSDDFDDSRKYDHSLEPQLKKVVDRYSENSLSDRSESPSFHSAHSRGSEVYDKSRPNAEDLKLKVPPLPNPKASNLSPKQPISKQLMMPTREPMVTSVSGDMVGLSDSYGSSTAYISRSQVPSQSLDTATSLESTGMVEKVFRRPKPSPRRPLDKMSSIRTDSVSSYAPSDRENMSPVMDDSDPFEEGSELEQSQNNIKHMKDLHIPARAKLGYTWT